MTTEFELQKSEKLNKLEEFNLAVRQRNSTDGRMIFIRRTKAGEALAKTIGKLVGVV